MHDALQNAPVIKQRRERRHNDHGAGDENPEDKSVFRAKCFAHQITVGERAENEFCPVRGKLDQLLDDLAGDDEKILARLGVQNQQRERELQADAPDDRAPRKVFPIVGDRPRHREHCDPAEQTDEF